MHKKSQIKYNQQNYTHLGHFCQIFCKIFLQTINQLFIENNYNINNLQNADFF